MTILIIDLGVIGSTYGYLFNKAGYETEHLIRKIMILHVNINDLMFVCKRLYDNDKPNGISAHVFYKCCE